MASISFLLDLSLFYYTYILFWKLMVISTLIFLSISLYRQYKRIFITKFGFLLWSLFLLCFSFHFTASNPCNSKFSINFSFVYICFFIYWFMECAWTARAWHLSSFFKERNTILSKINWKRQLNSFPLTNPSFHFLF